MRWSSCARGRYPRCERRDVVVVDQPLFLFREERKKMDHGGPSILFPFDEVGDQVSGPEQETGVVGGTGKDEAESFPLRADKLEALARLSAERVYPSLRVSFTKLYVVLYVGRFYISEPLLVLCVQTEFGPTGCSIERDRDDYKVRLYRSKLTGPGGDRYDWQWRRDLCHFQSRMAKFIGVAGWLHEVARMDIADIAGNEGVISVH